MNKLIPIANLEGREDGYVSADLVLRIDSQGTIYWAHNGTERISQLDKKMTLNALKEAIA